AVLLQTLEAIATVVARPAGTNSHAVAGRNALDALPYRSHGPGHLMTEEDRPTHSDRTEDAILIIVQMRPTSLRRRPRQELRTGRGQQVELPRWDIAPLVELADTRLHRNLSRPSGRMAAMW